MKRYIPILVILYLCVLLTGCDLWMDGSYHSVEPYQQEYVEPSPESAEVTTYDQLQQFLVDMVADGVQESVVYMLGFDRGELDGIVGRAAEYVTQSDPIGAYAVERVDYEIGTNTGRTAVKVNVSYIHNRAEILRIRKMEDMEQVGEAICQALKDCEAGVVLLVDEYEEMDFAQKAQDYMDATPVYCMEMPQVTASVYPQTGRKRVIELSFIYQTSRESLRTMQNYVEPVFRAAYLNVSGEEKESTKFERMYTFLMERSDYTVETSITPTYSLLRHGVGDSKAFATVYAAMCRQAGLECLVVSGTREGMPRVWNLICEDGRYSHVDLLASIDAGRLIRLADADMSGYVWDYSAYPAAEKAVQNVPASEPAATEPEVTEEPTQGETEPVSEPTEPAETEEPSEAEPILETVEDEN